jgi:hypothetical protein
MFQNKFMVFDVESIGLHGEGYAVGFVVVDAEGNKLDEGLYACHPYGARGSKEDFEWVEKNAPSIPPTHEAPWLMRAAFWRKWMQWKSDGVTILLADCAWPVEARFLTQCVDDSPLARKWDGPYPLHDLASFLLANGRNPLEKYGRIEGELPEHNPLCDAKQSARLLLGLLKPTFVNGD